MVIGDQVQLIPETGNVFDSDAIQVIFNNKPIGYVPNRGESCRTCWTHIRPGTLCSNCGDQTEPIKGGLATRLKGSGSLGKPYVAVVEDLDLNKLKINIYMVIE